jgi:hypothetical protein
MTPAIKLALAAGLGLVAAGVNMYVMNDRPAPRAFAVVRNDVRAGQTLDEASLGKTMIPGEVVAALPRTAVPYNQKETLYGRQTTRDLKRGDLVLWQDTAQPGWELSAGPDEEVLPISLDGLSTVPRLIRVGDQIGFLLARRKPLPMTKGKVDLSAVNKPEDSEVDYLGPFRVLSVGERVSREGKGPDRAGDDRIITVAMKLGPDRKVDNLTRQLVLARMNEPGSMVRIVGLVLHSKQRATELGPTARTPEPIAPPQ